MCCMDPSILTLGHRALSQPAEEVKNIDGRTMDLVSKMFDVLDVSQAIGLAATQIGVSKQIFVYTLGDVRRALFNPKIVESSGEWTYVEGCLSIPGVFVELVRPRTVLLSAVSADGEPVNVEATDLLARLYQHEVDHLNGVLMLQRLPEFERSKILEGYAHVRPL